MRNIRKNFSASNGSKITESLDKNTSISNNNRPAHDMACPSRKKRRKGSTRLNNSNTVRKYSPYEPDLMTTTPKLIRKLLCKQFSCTREAAYAYIQSIQGISLHSLQLGVPSVLPVAAATSTVVRSQILQLGSCCWTGSEATEAKAMLYEIIVSFTLNVGRRGWDTLSLKEFAENAVRNFIFAVQRVVQSIWLEPIRNYHQQQQQQQQQKTSHHRHIDRCTTTNSQQEHLDQQLEQEYFHTFTTLVYQIYALTHESLAFLCSTLEQSVLVPHHNPQQQQQQQQRCPLSSQVFTLPAYARPVVGQDGITLLIQRLEQELDIYFGEGDILPSTLSSSTFSSTLLATKHHASQRRIYGIIREAIIETNTNSRNDSNRTQDITTIATPTTSVEQQEEEYVFLQIVLGKLYPMEEKEKNCSSLAPTVATSLDDTKKFIVLYQPCSNLCVLATTGRRPPSKLVDITPKLLAALTATICGDTPGRFFHTGGNKEKAATITSGKFPIYGQKKKHKVTKIYSKLHLYVVAIL